MCSAHKMTVATGKKHQSAILRFLDLIFSASGIVFGFPIMLVIYVLGLLDTGAPLFFQKRVGKNEKLFTLIKFRTMAINTDSVGTHLVDVNSITRLGGFLRKTKLDELPQLFNVFLGDMSLVGPRPGLPNQIELIEERKARKIFEVRPGLTGLAQINGVDMSTPRKLARYDWIMANKMGLKLYLKLIIGTGLGKGRGDRVGMRQS